MLLLLLAITVISLRKHCVYQYQSMYKLQCFDTGFISANPMHFNNYCIA